MPGRSRSERTRKLNVQEAVLHKLGIPGSRLAARPGMTDVKGRGYSMLTRNSARRGTFGRNGSPAHNYSFPPLWRPKRL
jgi:hypothetical protein